ncbi:hypothetical protein BKA91DRAFT_9669 [Yarrowia lipolytica]|nr:hypothetical protein BKA91DRAFT_9669 [Yarrowia lipolytica]KAE8172113.1 hypothetical protein BKA90DRAFT_20030 [Yarrowia lipolytica]
MTGLRRAKFNRILPLYSIYSQMVVLVYASPTANRLHYANLLRSLLHYFPLNQSYDILVPVRVLYCTGTCCPFPIYGRLFPFFRNLQ